MTYDLNQILEGALSIAALALGVAGLFIARANQDVAAAALTPDTADDEIAARHLASAQRFQGYAQLAVDVLTLGLSAAIRRSVAAAARTSAQGPTPTYERVAGITPDETTPDSPAARNSR